MKWTSREIRYLEAHARDGAKAIAHVLGRSTDSVKWQASKLGISLQRRWHCKKCGRWSFKPLDRRTGWCATCTKESRRQHLENELKEMQEEVEREKDEDRRRQAIYSKKSRLKKSHTKNHTKNHTNV